MPTLPRTSTASIALKAVPNQPADPILIGQTIGTTLNYFAVTVVEAALFFATQALYSARGINLSEAELMQ